MNTQISIEWNYGRPINGANDDEARAAKAAWSVFEREGVDPMDCQREYLKQLEEFDEEAPMTGLALVWIAASRAADVALTEGWDKPDGAGCSIYAWVALK